MISVNGVISNQTEKEILGSEPYVYTSVRTVNKQPFRLERHLKRLDESARLEGFSLPKSISEIQKWVLDILAVTHYFERFIKISATRDTIVISNRQDMEMNSDIDQGVRVTTTPLRRTNVKAKRSQSPEMIEAYQKALSGGFYEALLHNTDRDSLPEGTRSNVVYVDQDGRLVWCDDALSGITQEAILEIAKDMEIPTRKGELNMRELGQIRELFLTQSSKEKGLVPILRVNTEVIGDGKCGPVAKKLMNGFRALTQKECPKPQERKFP